MSTICEVCGKKAKYVIGNVKFDVWCCDLCDEDIEITGKLPETNIVETNRLKKIKKSKK